MKVYAISDLHMDFKEEKPMSVFGGNWEGHIEKIREDWTSKVKEEDVVLIGGDLSWAIIAEDGVKDLYTLSDLPGKKVLVKGNHDYWWHSVTRLREKVPENFYLLQNDAVKIENLVVCGTRGWSVEGSPDFTEQDRKIYLREAERAKLAFCAAKKLIEKGDRLVFLTHFPPFNAKRENSLITDIISQNGADAVIYGHLHGKDARADFLVVKDGVKYYLTSCDLTSNKLTLIF